ncbi:MAG: porin [Bauldia litoralis]
MKYVTNSHPRALGVMKAALLGGTALALAGGTGAPASAASMVDRGIERRVSDLEAEVRLLKNRVKALEDRKLAVPDKIVVSGNSRVKVTLYGQVNRAVRFSFQSRDTEVHHVDNDLSSSRIGILAQGRLFPDMTIGAVTEVEWQENPRSATDDNNDGNETLRARKVELWFTHATMGSLYLGHGDTAAKDIEFLDLSGTDIVASSAGCGDDGLRFGPGAANVGASGLPFASACLTLDGSRQNRIMYVSPSIAGFAVKVSHGEQDQFEAAIVYEDSPFGLKDIKVVAGFGYTYAPTKGASIPALGAGSFSQYAGSASILHVPTGLSLTFAGGYRTFLGTNAVGVANPHYWYVKGGYQSKFWSMGTTYLSLDFGSYNQMAPGDIHGWSIGGAVVQAVDTAATDLYAGLRYQDAKTAGAGLNGAMTLLIGARIKF